MMMRVRIGSRPLLAKGASQCGRQMVHIHESDVALRTPSLARAIRPCFFGLKVTCEAEGAITTAVQRTLPRDQHASGEPTEPDARAADPTG